MKCEVIEDKKMRLSINADDSGYNLELAMRSKIYLDGIKQLNALTADEELGYIKRYRINSRGEVYILKDSIETEEVYGKVEIVLNEKA